MHKFYLVLFIISGFVHLGEILMLTLDKRDFIYKYNYKIKEPTSHAKLIDFPVKDWSNISKLKEIQAEAN